jgi:hypothetical protein
VDCYCCRQHVRASASSSSSASPAAAAAAAAPQQQQQQQQGRSTTFHHGITYTAYGGNSFHVKFNTTGEAWRMVYNLPPAVCARQATTQTSLAATVRGSNL